ncbi:MAG: hypothetical protein AB7L66_02445 [Gemmatimonadales bacterium]
MRRVLGWLGVAGALGACHVTSSPVPVRGSVEPLVGEWAGEYVSKETGRTGSIVFTLEAGADTARGDVLMIPQNPEYPPTSVPRTDDPVVRAPRVLKISFVRCEGAEVTGWLDPYPDPDTGEKTTTTFEGVIRGNKLEGTFVSFLEMSGKRRSGTWSVTRKAAASK